MWFVLNINVLNCSHIFEVIILKLSLIVVMLSQTIWAGAYTHKLSCLNLRLRDPEVHWLRYLWLLNRILLFIEFFSRFLSSENFHLHLLTQYFRRLSVATVELMKIVCIWFPNSQRNCLGVILRSKRLS